MRKFFVGTRMNNFLLYDALCNTCARYEIWLFNFVFGISHASHYLIFRSDCFVSNYTVSVVN